jgi:hypothetical protein
MTNVQTSHIPLKKTKIFNRFICKNSVFISNLPENILNKDILYQKKFIGQYGHIKSIIFLNNQKKDEKNLIVNFDTINQAALCILSLNNLDIAGKKIKIKYFQTNLCHYYLNNLECKLSNCIYLHTKQINSYIFKNLEQNENIDSLNLALKILNLNKVVYDKIYNKLIGDNFYNNNLKFPKLTIKKLKKYFNQRNNNKNHEKYEKNIIYGINNLNFDNMIKEKEEKDDNKYKYLHEKSTSSESSSNNEISYSNSESFINSFSFLNNSNNSRFNFVEENNENINNRIEIPICVLNLIKSVLINQINNNNKIINNNYKFINYFVKWKIFIDKINDFNN